MNKRTNLGKANARNSARSRRRGNLLDLMDALGISTDEQRAILQRAKERATPEMPATNDAGEQSECEQ